MVQEAAHDDATIAFLLSQTLMAQQRAEEEAKEVEVLEADLGSKEQRLLEEIERLRTSADRGARGSHVEVAAAWWLKAKLAWRKRQRKKKEEEEEAEEEALVPVQLLFMTSFDNIFPSRPVCLTVLCPVSVCRLTST